MIDYNFKALMDDERAARSKRDHQILYEHHSVNYVLLTTFGRHLACKRIISRHVPGERLAVYRLFRPHIFDSAID